MEELKISDMLKTQYELWEAHKDKWSPMEPKAARNFFLWMIEEIGEVIAIIKKKGEDKIMEDETVKDMFKEELVDVLMYYLDILNRYGITGQEITEAYIKKHEYNMKRDYEKQHSNFITNNK